QRSGDERALRRARDAGFGRHLARRAGKSDLADGGDDEAADVGGGVHGAGPYTRTELISNNVLKPPAARCHETEANLLTVLYGSRRRPPPATGTAHPDLHTQLYWESTGDGPPLLLVMGLGLSGGAWWRTVETLSRTFRVITFDNRGVGRSRGLTPAYTTEALADDAVAVLHAPGVHPLH